VQGKLRGSVLFGLRAGPDEPEILHLRLKNGFVQDENLVEDDNMIQE
jgi:hypothetical protein